MHERALVSSIVEQILDEMRTRGLDQIVSVQLQVGEFSGVEPALIEIAFAELSAMTWDDAVQLNLEVVPLSARCRHCAAAFQVEQFRFVCPKCTAGDVQITAGEEIRIASLSVARRVASQRVGS